jgi:hypothetical protein
LLLGLGLSLILASPYLLWESAHGFHSWQVYLGIGTSGGVTTSADGPRIDLSPLHLIVTMAGADHYPDMMGYGFRHDFSLPDVADQNTLSLCLLGLGLATCAGQLAWWLRRGRPADYQWEKYLLLLLWLILPLLVTVRHSIEFFNHYFIIMYPLQFVLIGIGLTAPGQAIGRLPIPARRQVAYAASGVAVAAVVFVVAGYAGFYRSYVDLVVANGPSWPYGVPLAFSQRAVDTARELHERYAGDRVYVYSYLQRRALDYLGLPDLDLRQVADPPVDLVIPSDPGAGAVYVLASGDTAEPAVDYGLVKDNGPLIVNLRNLGLEELSDKAILAQDGHCYYRFFHLPQGASGKIVASFTPVSQPVSLSNGLRLLGYSLPEQAQPGGRLTIRLLWQQPGGIPSNPPREYNLFVHLSDGSGRVLVVSDSELHRYADWRSDDMLITYHDLGIPTDAGPTLAWLDVGAYSRYDRAEVTWRDAQGRTLGSPPKLGPVKISPARPSQPPSQVVDYRFGEGLALVGYDLSPARPAAGDDLTVALRWRALAPSTVDYAVSVQLLDGEGHLVAQHDSPPASGQYPTSSWSAGEEIVDSHTLKIPRDAPAGAYKLVAVVYSVTGQKRLLLPGGSDYAPLAQVSLSAGR